MCAIIHFMKNIKKDSKVLLIIRDGWGYSSETKYNMIAQANTQYTDYLEKNYPTTLLNTCGEEVGLPDGYFGNSEVGHMTIGAGRILEQSLLRINNSIEDGSFFKNKEFINAICLVKKYNSKLHLIGLLQKEGVHSHFNHLIALLELSKQQGLKKDDVYIHVITDGRDAGEQNAINYVLDLEKEMTRIGIGKIVTLAGRYFAMDRDNNWDRIKKYYDVICNSNKMDSGSNRILRRTFIEPQDLLKEKYNDSEFSDEFLEPISYKKYDGLQEHDSIIDFNFRKDRERQIAHIFNDKHFSKFDTCHKNIYFVSMTNYYKQVLNVAFPDIKVKYILGQILEDYNRTQLRISETEKYAHVTFFFDGGEDYDFNGEKKIIISSPKVNTFDLKPEMASVEITKTLINEIENNAQDFILCNFPNADMVGHTGKYEAIKEAIYAVDRSLEAIIPVALENNYVVMVTADHGNAEYKHGKYLTSHTNNKVPFTIISNDLVYEKIVLKDNCGLKNILSTVLKILNIRERNIYEESIF